MSKKSEPIPFFGNMPGISLKFLAWVKAIIFGTLALSYIFWGLDVIPDVTGPIVGFVDDAIIFIAAAWAIRGALRTILDKKDMFLGRKRK